MQAEEGGAKSSKSRSEDCFLMTSRARDRSMGLMVEKVDDQASASDESRASG